MAGKRLASPLLWLAVVVSPAIAQDVPRVSNAAIYERHCAGCHDERKHDAMRSQIFTLSDLRRKVRVWENNRGRTKLTDEETDAIVDYLNERHYRIGLTPRDKR